MTIVGSDDATEEGSVSVMPVTRAMVVGIGTCRSNGVGCPVNSLKEAPRLLDTVVSSSSSDDFSASVKPVQNGVNYGAGTGEANHWDTYSIDEGNYVTGCP